MKFPLKHLHVDVVFFQPEGPEANDYKPIKDPAQESKIFESGGTGFNRTDVLNAWSADGGQIAEDFIKKR